MQPTRGLGSAPLPPANRGCALLFGLAPGRVCRVSLRPRRAGIVTVALVLASRRTGVTRCPALGSSDFPHAHRLPGGRATVRPPRWPAECRAPARGLGPTAGLGRTTDAGPPACARSMRLVGQPVGHAVERARHVRRGPALEARQRAHRGRHSGCSFASLTRQRPCELLHDQLRVEQQVDLARPELAGELERPDHARVLGDVVGLDAQVVGDRRVGRGRGRRGASGRSSRRTAPRRATPDPGCRARRRRCG